MVDIARVIILRWNKTKILVDLLLGGEGYRQGNSQGRNTPTQTSERKEAETPSKGPFI